MTYVFLCERRGLSTATTVRENFRHDSRGNNMCSSQACADQPGDTGMEAKTSSINPSLGRYESGLPHPERPPAPIRESWWLKQLALLIALQAAGLAFGLLLHSTALGGIQFPQAGDKGYPVTAGNLPPGTAAVTTFAWVATVQAIACYLIFGRLYHRMRQHSSEMSSTIHRQNEELSRTREAMVVGLSHLASTCDGDGDGHHDRVGQLAELLAQAASKRPEFAGQITPDFIRCIRISAMLHDIGKVGIQDAILLKPGRLTARERLLMERHTRISSDCLTRIESCLGDANFLGMAHRIALFHHERWDGTGYPASLYRDNIPLEARITAIADVYDALSSSRSYKKAYPHEVCVRLICESTGTQFDPRLIEVFLSVAGQFAELSVPDSDPLPATAETIAPSHQQSNESSEPAAASDNMVDLSSDTADMTDDVFELCLKQAGEQTQPTAVEESANAEAVTITRG